MLANGALRSSRRGAGHLIAWTGTKLDAFFSLGTLDPLADTASDQDEALLAEAETVLASSNYGAKFSALIEHRFQQSTARPRQRLFVRCALVGTLIYNLFLFVDMVVVPDVMWLALPLQLGVVTPIILAAIVAIRRFDFNAEIASLLCVSLMVAVTITMFLASRSPGVGVFAGVFVLFLMSGNVALAMGFATSLVFTLLHLAAASTAIMIHPLLDMPERVFAIALLLATANYSLAGSYRIDAGLRSAYLFALRESLRARLLDVSNRALKTLVLIDGLTGVANRRHLDALMAAHWREPRSDHPLAFLMIDIDHFKRFNDDHGHQIGDECLRQVAQRLAAETAGEPIVVVRYGGEEFAVLRSDLALSGAVVLAERLRRAVERLRIPTEAGAPLAVTISVGCAVASPAGTPTGAEIIAAADAALYEAKRAGRNRVGIAGMSPAIPHLPDPSTAPPRSATHG